MAMVRWSPTGNLDIMQRRWNSLFDEVFGSSGDEEVINQIWAPRVDLEENENAYLVHADLPGLTKDDVDISVENGVLTINGERKLERDKKDHSYHLSERAFGRFTRSFNLRNRVDVEKVNASFKNGVLTISMPKLEQVKPKKITIKAN